MPKCAARGRNRGIGGTGIGETFDFFGKQRRTLLCAFKHETAGQKQRLIVFAVLRLLFAAADGQGLRVKCFAHVRSICKTAPVSGRERDRLIC